MTHHRQTIWRDEEGNVWQVSVACLDDYMEAHVEVTLAVGPFDELEHVLYDALTSCHGLGGWRAHQKTLALE